MKGLFFQEVRKNLCECIQIFGYETLSLPEGQLTAIAKLDLLEVDIFVKNISWKKRKTNYNA